MQARIPVPHRDIHLFRTYLYSDGLKDARDHTKSLSPGEHLNSKKNLNKKSSVYIYLYVREGMFCVVNLAP